MVISIVLVLMIISIYLYNRYVPVLGVPCVKDMNQMDVHTKIIDVRDYNYVQDAVPDAISIPVAYLQRNHKQFNGGKVIILASSH